MRSKGVTVKIKPTNERVEEEKEKERPYLLPPPYKPHVRIPQKIQTLKLRSSLTDLWKFNRNYTLMFL